MSLLFQTLNIGTLPLANRIIIAPMCQYSAVDGNAQDWHLMHLGHLALSGAGLMIIEATAVSPEGRITPGDLGLYSDDNETALARVVVAIRTSSDMPLAIQLAHAGRKASSRAPWEGGGQILPDAAQGWKGEAPSALPHAPGEDTPTALDAEGLERVKDAFVQTAKRSVRLGFQGIELHMAHGYLLHQFLSPLSNERTDDYGGSQRARMRFPLEVFDAVKAAVPDDMPVWVRVSATDWVPGGWDLDSTVALAQALKERGCAAIHVSTGGVSPKQQIPVGPGFQVPFAARIKAETGLPTIAVGLITEPEQAEKILQDGDADAIALARSMLYNPRWPWHAAAALGAQVEAPEQYWRSQPREFATLFKDMKVGQR
ncbi:NADH:flavin oxidoreductase/NADH oxidase [Thalassobacter stenotrophicus]|uniref:NADPH dehydrogenase n=2 Tax=Thalassobacter stenotrophicus TaxID=266809 RepID=A0A0N7LTT5_9RHOB|nr:NADH:flavin oxidoreductase/NADH oxidase [Thalassobacter stenotrophicus]CUH61594.1 NADPH dehydrogenase [Thalassobacter stenotrophicus]SHJ35000.1 2,4-dienoyl-CoA reductase [Thalassobacter stenotrophicus DSM 16310]